MRNFRLSNNFPAWLPFMNQLSLFCFLSSVADDKSCCSFLLCVRPYQHLKTIVEFFFVIIYWILFLLHFLFLTFIFSLVIGICHFQAMLLILCSLMLSINFQKYSPNRSLFLFDYSFICCQFLMPILFFFQVLILFVLLFIYPSLIFSLFSAANEFSFPLGIYILFYF